MISSILFNNDKSKKLTCSVFKIIRIDSFFLFYQTMVLYSNWIMGFTIM